MRELNINESNAVAGGIPVSSPQGPGTVPYAPWGPTGLLTAGNYTPPYSNIDFGYIEYNEGGSSLTFYLPANNYNDRFSGWTVGAGIDISQMSTAQINSLFGDVLSPSELGILDKYSYTYLNGTLGVSHNNFDNFLQTDGSPGFSLSPRQAYEVNAAVYNDTFNVMANQYLGDTGKSFSTLPNSLATVAADLAINIGPGWLNDSYLPPADRQAAKDFLAGNWSAFEKDLGNIPTNHQRMLMDAATVQSYLGSTNGAGLLSNGDPTTTGGNITGSSPWPTWYGWWDFEWVQGYVNGQPSGNPVLVQIGGW